MIGRIAQDTQTRFSRLQTALGLRDEATPSQPKPIEHFIFRGMENDLGQRDLTRKHVLRLAEEGQWTPEQAEAWAKDNNQAPFQQIPGPGQFNPARETYWTLLMILVWLVYRDMSKVQEVWPEFLDAHKLWSSQSRGDGKSGCFLVVPSCKLDFNKTTGYALEPAAARTILRQLLKDGRLVAAGQDNTSGSRRKIEPHEWVDTRPIDLEKPVNDFNSDLYYNAGGRKGATGPRILPRVRSGQRCTKPLSRDLHRTTRKETAFQAIEA